MPSRSRSGAARQGLLLLLLFLGSPAAPRAVGAVGADPGNYVWAYNDSIGGSICNPDLTRFDCNADGNRFPCESYRSLQSCLDVCDADPLCRWVTYGLDTTFGGWYRCATFIACPTQNMYDDGDPQLYYKQPAGVTTYELAYNDAFCNGGNVLFDCYVDDPSLFPTYEACGEFSDIARCQAECDARSDCNFMLWGYDDGDYYRCVLFDVCDGFSEYLSGKVQVWRKTVPPDPGAGTTAAPPPTAAPLPNHCLRIVTGSSEGDAGSLMVSIDTGSGLRLAAGGVFVLGQEVLVRCDTNPFEEVQLTSSSNDAWAGTVEYSRDGGETYTSFLCETCTVVANADKIVVDGNADDSDLAPTGCFNGEPCRFVPRDRHCVRSVTGSEIGDDGSVAVAILAMGTAWAQTGTYGLRDTVVERCFSDPVAQIYVKNPSQNAWRGSFLHSTDFGVSWQSMECSGCAVGSNSSSLLVKAELEATEEAGSHCLGGCALLPSGSSCEVASARGPGVGAAGAGIVGGMAALALLLLNSS